MDNMNIGDNDDMFTDDDGEEIFKTGNPILWQLELMNNFGDANSVELTENFNDTFSKPCRNSIQVNINSFFSLNILLLL